MKIKHYHSLLKKLIVDENKDDNFLSYRKNWEDYPLNAFVANYPLHIDIESSGLCNLRCGFCATTNQRWGEEKRGVMKYDLYKRIIDESLEYNLCSIKLSFRGEPLLCADLYRRIIYAKGNNVMDIYFNTNGLLLNQETIFALIDANLPRISISVEGTNAKTYEKYRVGGNFELLKKNIINLWEIRNKKNRKHPRIRIQTILIPEVKIEIESYVKFWQNYADEIGGLELQPETENDFENSVCKEFCCPSLWQRMSILWDGEILPCQAHGVRDLSLISLGNIKTHSIKKLWHSSQMNKLRTLHTKGLSHKVKFCRECSFRAMYIRKANLY